MKKIALAAIVGYQRYISPVKGFSCAYRVHTGGENCSAYGYRMIERYGVRVGLGLLRRRLDACGEQFRQHRPDRMTKRTNAAGVPGGPNVPSGPNVPLPAHQQAGFIDCACAALDLGSLDLAGCDTAISACDVIGNCASCGLSLAERTRDDKKKKPPG